RIAVLDCLDGTAAAAAGVSLFALLQRAGFPEKAVRNTSTPDREKCSRADETKKRLSALSISVRRGGTEWRPSAAGGGRGIYPLRKFIFRSRLGLARDCLHHQCRRP